MPKQVNYRQVFARKKQAETTLKKYCPTIENKSGIYIFYRYTYDGKWKMYIGQSVALIDRLVSHINGYSHIDISLRKWGWYNKNTNPYGWSIHYYYCPKNELDNMERAEIKKWLDKGVPLYNITSGGQNEGKTDINERKSSKGYFDGVKYGQLKIKKQVQTYFDKYLDYSIKPKPNKIKEKKYAEFTEFLQEKPEKNTESGKN